MRIDPLLGLKLSLLITTYGNSDSMHTMLYLKPLGHVFILFVGGFNGSILYNFGN